MSPVKRTIVKNHPQATSSSRHRRRKLAVGELLEARQMLTSVPLSIDVTQTTQQIFMGDELLTIDTASDHIVYRYAVGGPNDASQVNFQLERAAATAVDAALGFYDPSGNLLTQVDASDSTPWSEQASQILETEAVHFLGVFFDQSVSPGDFELTVSQPTIPHAPSLPIDIGTGMLQYVASSDGDALNSPSDVEFYSLDLTNGGTSGTVMVQPLGIDGEIYAELLYREGSHQPYREIDSASDASGQAVSLTLTPSPGRSLAHGEYVLAVSTEGFDGAPGAFQIDVDASPVLVPGSLTNPTVDSSLASPAPIQLGASSTTASGGIDANDDVIYRIKTTNSGDVKLSVASSADIIASIYEEDGSGLLGVYQNPTLEPLNLAPDSAYLLRLSSETDASFDLTATTTFTPQDAPLSNQQFSDTFVAGADQPLKHFRVSPGFEDDVLVVRVNQSAARPLRIVVASDYLSPIEYSSSDRSIFLPIDISTNDGPIDIFVEGTSSPSTVGLQVGVVDVPLTINPATLPVTQVRLDGSLSSTASSGGFGSVSGAQFAEPLREETDAGITFRADNRSGNLTSGPNAALAVYRQTGSSLKLVDFVLPEQDGTATLFMPDSLTFETNYAAVGINVSPIHQGIVEYEADGENIAFVGVQMVPDIEDTIGFSSIFSVRNVTLQSEMDRDRWKTILPYNILNSSPLPRVTFVPVDGSIRARVRVWVDSDGNFDPVGDLYASQVMTPSNSSLLINQPIADLQSATVYFEVEPIAGQLGSGEYTLEMSVDTTDSVAYLVDAEAYRFAGTTPIVNPQPAFEQLPNIDVVDIEQNQFGDGFAEATFTNPNPDTAGSVDIYRFWAVTPGALSVRTIGLSEDVNTNLRIYKSAIASNGVEYLDLVDAADVLGDWFPADRSTIDDQAYVNNYRELSYGRSTATYDTGGGYYYAVVKNEQATLGDYRIEVNAQSFPLLGQGNNFNQAKKSDVVQLPANQSGVVSTNMSLPYVSSINEFAGIVPIQMPAYHDSTLYIEGETNASWKMALFDEAGNQLTGTVEQTGAPGPTQALFQVPAGSRTVYLRLNELQENASADTNLLFRTNVIRPSSIPAPAALLPNGGNEQMLLTLPSGDTSVDHTDIMSAENQVKKFGLQLPAGRTTISVTPQSLGGQLDVELQWAVYVDGDLWTWNDTRTGGDGTSLSILLPSIRPPLDNSDFDYDTGQYHDVVIHVTSRSTPQNGGDFSISVATESHLPISDGFPLAFSPKGWIATLNDVMDGKTFKRVHIPQGFESMTLSVGFEGGGAPTGTEFVYELYTPDGQLVSTATAFSSLLNPLFLLDDSLAGGDYFLRAGAANDADQSITVTLKGTNSRNEIFSPFPRPVDQFELGTVGRLAIGPNGIRDFTISFPSNPTVFNSVFWVGQAGVTTVEVDMGFLDDHLLSLYRVESRGTELGALQDAVLVDFVNGDDFANGKYTLNTYLETGAYLVQAERSSEFGTVDVYVEIPKYVSQEVVLNPNTGDSNVDAAMGFTTSRDVFGVDAVNAHPSGNFVADVFRTAHYRAIAPAGTQGMVTGTATNFDNDFAPNTASLSAEGGTVFQSMTAASAGSNTVEGVYSPAVPLDEYFISVWGRRDSSFAATIDPIGAGFNFDVPESGTPDLVVEPLTLSPNQGETLVGVVIKNVGFGSSAGTLSEFRYSDTSKSPVSWTEADIFESALGPASKPRRRALEWLPVKPSDRVEYFADANDTIAEVDETNNQRDDVLSRVNAHAPQVTIVLEDQEIDGNVDPDVYGRYITQVHGVTSNVLVSFSDADGNGHLHDVIGRIPDPSGGFPGPQGLFYSQRNPLASLYYDFGNLMPTTPNNPNEFRMVPRDIYGLKGEEVVKTVQVQQFPGWLTPINSNQLTFNTSTLEYDIRYRNALLDVGGEGQVSTLNELVGADIPFVGDLENRLLAEVGADTSASLDPDEFVAAEIFAHAEVVILGEEIFNETYTPNVQINDYMAISGELRIDGDSLDSDFIAITFSITDLPLFDFQSPEITLFAYGVPNVASINANLQFSLSATLDAAVTVGIEIDDNDPNQLLLPTRIGIASPSFVAPTVVAGLSVAGEVEILGFDIAQLAGNIHMSLTPAYGLSSPKDELIDFVDFFDHDCLQLTGQVWGGISAEVIGIEVFDFQLDPIDIPFPNGCSVVMSRGGGDLGGTTTIPGGTDMVGSVADYAHPELVIDPSDGQARYVQLVDVDPDAAIVRQGIAFSRRRTNGTWSDIRTLSGDGGQHVANPVMALTNDAVNAPVLLAYQSIAASDPAQLTRNQYLSGQELVYRYYDGTNWTTPANLTNDNRYDSAHSMAFNNVGDGAMAWVSNGSATPIDSQGRFDRSLNEIKVARWDASAKSFVGSTTLTNNVVGDGEPAVYTAADGQIYVVWVQDTTFDATDHFVTGNQLMYSVYDPIQDTWSLASVLGIDGIPAEGKLGGVAMGTNGAGRINVLVSHSNTLANRQVESTLFHRVSTQAEFESTHPVSKVTEDLNFAHLRTTNAPDGSLVAYWMGGDGQRNNIWASRLTAAGSAPALWSEPFTLTAQDGDALPFVPSIAVDTNDEYQLVYEMRSGPVSPLPDFPVTNGHPDGDPAFEAPTMGNVMSSSYAELPELGFETPFHIEPAQTLAVSGSQVIGEAMIVNTGLVADNVTIEYFDDANGTLQILRSETIRLAPGQSYPARHTYQITSGLHSYGVQLTATMAEVLGTSDNQSFTKVEGVADAAITSMELSDAEPDGGDTITVSVEVANMSDLDVTGDVVVQLWSGSPSWEFYEPVRLDEVILSNRGLPAGASAIANFTYNVPFQAGLYPLTAVVVANDVLKSNNEMTRTFKLVPEVELRNISAELLDDSGVDNVRVNAVIGNTGNSRPGRVDVELYHSLDGGDFSLIDTRSVQMNNRTSANVSFLAPGLAGRTGQNRYRVLTNYLDENQMNQMQQTLLLVQGLADIHPSKLTLSGSFVQDEPIMATFDVENLGIATADFVQVEVFGNLLGSEQRFLLGETTIDSLQPLSLTALTIPIETYPFTGFTQICVVVDRDQTILELTDFNNTDCVTASFSPKDDLDYGDAPATYAVLLDDNGARHASSPTNLLLGQNLDHESRPIPSLATSDDTRGTDDEDGIVLGNVYVDRNATIQVEVSGDQPGYFNGWLDFGSDGSWGEQGDQIFDDLLLTPGLHTLHFAVPADSRLGDTFARFRISTTVGLGFMGRAEDGEVEDYPLTIEADPNPLSNVVFVAARADNQVELFQSNGTSSGTNLLKNIGGSQSSNPHELTVVGDDLYFAATGADGEIELFRTFPTGRTSRVKDLAGAISSNPHELIDFGGRLYFVATGPDNNTELYTTDGTNTGTYRIKNLSGDTSADPADLTVMNGVLYFTALSENGERELYRSDGTSPGTQRIVNLYGQNTNANPSDLTVIGDTLYFVATVPGGERELHASDGTASGTTLVANIGGPLSSLPTQLTEFANELYFVATGADGQRELWKSDGSAAGTSIVADLYGTQSSLPEELTVFDDRLFFVASLPSGESELHVTDGFAANTVLFVNLHGGTNANPQELTVAGDSLFFSAMGSDGEREIYSTMGFADGTGRLKDIAGATSSNPTNLAAVGDQLYFSASLATGERELYTSNGTSDGTTLVKNLAGSPDPRSIIEFEVRPEFDEAEDSSFDDLPASNSGINPSAQWATLAMIPSTRSQAINKHAAIDRVFEFSTEDDEKSIQSARR